MTTLFILLDYIYIIGFGVFKDDFSPFVSKVVAHKEEGHNFMTNGWFVISLIGANGRKPYLNIQMQGAVIPDFCKCLITTSF